MGAKRTPEEAEILAKMDAVPVSAKAHFLRFFSACKVFVFGVPGKESIAQKAAAIIAILIALPILFVFYFFVCPILTALVFYPPVEFVLDHWVWCVFATGFWILYAAQNKHRKK